jgi:hypothetical protein
MDPLDDLIDEAFASAPLPHRSWEELRAAKSDRNSEPIKMRAKAALLAIEGRGLTVIEADIRALIPLAGPVLVSGGQG